MEQPHKSAISTSSDALMGASPLSQFLTVSRETLSRFPNCSWERPSFTRSEAILFFIEALYVLKTGMLKSMVRPNWAYIKNLR